MNIFGALFIIGGLIWLAMVIMRSSYVTGADVVREQPVQFSHQHHVQTIGIDCRYCHTSVETSAFAGIPPTKTCMPCHAQIWSTSPYLEPVRASFRDDKSLRWLRVHDLPNFAFFDHGVHVKKGVGCETCHGRVDEMPLVRQKASLQMEWCLDCHRNPERYVRPRSEDLHLGIPPREASVDSWTRTGEGVRHQPAHQLLSVPPVSDIQILRERLEGTRGGTTGAAWKRWPTRRSSGNSCTGSFRRMPRNGSNRWGSAAS